MHPIQRLAVAPMLQWTDRHCRYLLRLLSRQAFLYTEMVTTGAILQGKRLDLLQYHPEEHPLVLQLGGSEPQALAECARMAEGLGFDQVNLNVGCPSGRVQLGRFGACLFKEPDLVAYCIETMCSAVSIPITVKTRIGVDDLDSYQALQNFISRVSGSGCQTFILHARKAWLKGLSPKENREIPPLCYETVYQIKQDFPDLEIIINGGIETIEQIQNHLKYVDGVMLGRSVYQNPMLLGEIPSPLAGEELARHSLRSGRRPDGGYHTPHTLVQAYIPYMVQELSHGTSLSAMARHLLTLFQGQPGARAWRRYLSEHMHKEGVGLEVITEALTCHPAEGRDPVK